MGVAKSKRAFPLHKGWLSSGVRLDVKAWIARNYSDRGTVLTVLTAFHGEHCMVMGFGHNCMTGGQSQNLQEDALTERRCRNLGPGDVSSAETRMGNCCQTMYSPRESPRHVSVEIRLALRRMFRSGNH